MRAIDTQNFAEAVWPKDATINGKTVFRFELFRIDLRLIVSYVSRFLELATWRGHHHKSVKFYLVPKSEQSTKLFFFSPSSLSPLFGRANRTIHPATETTKCTRSWRTQRNSENAMSLVLFVYFVSSLSSTATRGTFVSNLFSGIFATTISHRNYSQECARTKDKKGRGEQANGDGCSGRAVVRNNVPHFLTLPTNIQCIPIAFIFKCR